MKLLLFVALVLAIGWLILRLMRGRPSPPQKPTPQLQDATSMYHAVSIKYSSSACDAAKALTGRRFLSSAAPRLPLPDCDALECRCQFAHHKDRRSGKDRRSPFAPGGSSATGTYRIERRQKKDRRKDADL